MIRDDAKCCIRKWTRRKEARPAEIVEAALDLFVEKGFQATKMEDIAKRAGVTKGTPYLYFANKEDIFKEVIRSSWSARLSSAEETIRQYQGSMQELLRQCVLEWWQWTGESRLSGIPKLMMAEAGNFPELTKFYGEEVIARSETLLREVVSRGIAQGEFRPVDVDYAVGIMMAPMMKAVLWKHSFGCALGMFDMERYLACFFDLLLNGLANRDVPAQ